MHNYPIIHIRGIARHQIISPAFIVIFVHLKTGFHYAALARARAQATPASQPVRNARWVRRGLFYKNIFWRRGHYPPSRTITNSNGEITSQNQKTAESPPGVWLLGERPLFRDCDQALSIRSCSCFVMRSSVLAARCCISHP